MLKKLCLLLLYGGCLCNNVFNFNQSLNFFYKEKKTHETKKDTFWILFSAFFFYLSHHLFLHAKIFFTHHAKKTSSKIYTHFSSSSSTVISLPDTEAQSFGEMSIFSGEDAVILTSGTTVVC